MLSTCRVEARRGPVHGHQCNTHANLLMQTQFPSSGRHRFVLLFSDHGLELRGMDYNVRTSS